MWRNGRRNGLKSIAAYRDNFRPKYIREHSRPKTTARDGGTVNIVSTRVGGWQGGTRWERAEAGVVREQVASDKTAAKKQCQPKAKDAVNGWL